MMMSNADAAQVEQGVCSACSPTTRRDCEGEQHSSNTSEDEDPICEQPPIQYELLKRDQEQRRSLRLQHVTGPTSRHQQIVQNAVRTPSYNAFSSIPIQHRKVNGITLYTNSINSAGESGVSASRRQYQNPARHVSERNRNLTRYSQEEIHVDIIAIGADEVRTPGVASNPSEHRCIDTERSADPARNSLSSQELSNPSRQTCQPNQNHSSNPKVHYVQGDLGALQTRRNNTAKRRKNGNWEDFEMRAAIAAVNDGMTIRKEATKYGIPRSSLEDSLYRRTRSRRRGK
jgi:hypothetical protein